MKSPVTPSSSSSSSNSTTASTTAQKYSMGPIDDSLLTGSDASSGGTTTILAASSVSQMKPTGDFWNFINFLQTLRPFVLLETELPLNIRTYIGGEVQLVSFNFKIFSEWTQTLTSWISIDVSFNGYSSSSFEGKLDTYGFGQIMFLSYIISC